MSMGEKRSSAPIYKREGKTHQINMRVSISELEQLNKMSFEDDIPVAQVIRNAIKRYADDRKNKE